MAKMEKTSLLSPVKGVQMVWALTGKFAKDKRSQFLPSQVEEEIKRLRKYVEGGSEKGPERGADEDAEKRYVSRALVAMEASLRSLHTIYKGRDLNFDENERLRSASLKSVEESMQFGTRLRDLLKSLPGMTVGGVSGATFGQHFVAQFLEEGKNAANGTTNGANGADAFLESGILLWTIVAIGIVAGYLLNWLFLAWVGRRRQRLYFRQDYDRNLYYHQYLRLVREILRSLYEDLDQIHKDSFEKIYSIGNKNQYIGEILAEAEPRHCAYVDKHMQEKKITPELWPLCETGEFCETGDPKKSDMKAAVKECPHWKAEKYKDEMDMYQILWYWLRCLRMRIW